MPTPDIIVKLPVPFISQLASGALRYNNDCGPTSACMLVRSINPMSTITPDKFYTFISSPWISEEDPDPKLDHRAIEAGMRACGIETNYTQELTRGKAFEYLSQKIPMMIGVTYGILVDAGVTQMRSFRDGHWMVLHGITLSHYIVRDPFRNDGTEELYLPHQLLEAAMGYVERSSMSARTAIIPRIGIGSFVEQVEGSYLYAVRPTRQINVRSTPRVPPVGSELLNWVRYAMASDTLLVLDDSDPMFYRIGPSEFVVKSLCRRITP